MSDLDIGNLASTMGKILLAVVEFTLSAVPIGILALLSAYIFTFQDRSHFFERKLPRTDALVAFSIGLGAAHAFLTFMMALTLGVDGSSALTVITYSVCTVWTLTVGFFIGGGILWGLCRLVMRKFWQGKEAGGNRSGSYRPVTTADETELESGNGKA